MKKYLKIGMMLIVFIILFSSLGFARLCPRCGYNNKEDYKFCIKCGSPLTAEAVLKQEEMRKEKLPSKLLAPKKTIAVVGFENTSGLQGYIKLGEDFAAQLTDALIKSGKFIVLSRTELDKIFTEQDLVESARLAKSFTAKKGKVIPAQILVTGKITEFEENKEVDSQGLTIHGVTLGGSKSSAHIAVIIQIIDSTTGEVLDSRRVEGGADARGFRIGYSGSWSIGSSSFKKTPLGKATQIAIDRAVVYIADRLSQIPWQGRVVTVKEGVVYINAGSQAGITSGMKFAVYRQGESLIDPETGIELGAEKEKIGEISVIEAESRFSKAKILNSTKEIRRGDLVLEY